MKTEFKIPVRAYHVTLRDTRTGEVMNDTIVLEKSRLQAGALFDLGDEDIIYRIYNRKGYRVLEIKKPIKRDIVVDLSKLYWYQIGAEADKELSSNQECASADITMDDSGSVDPVLLAMG